MTTAVFSIAFKTLFLVCADRKPHWFDKARYDDVERWNAMASG